ncbi:uncharacterized protein LOC141572119 [Rhinolophus sinicus]|uniref:uncharacterized protein LOC141572119 n=1 Tax=Rhinolophus sinicus TaxID=89399 RepID=UPI003D79579B
MASARRRWRPPGCTLRSAPLGSAEAGAAAPLLSAARRSELRARAAVAAVAAADRGCCCCCAAPAAGGGSAGSPERPPSADLSLSYTLPPPLLHPRCPVGDASSNPTSDGAVIQQSLLGKAAVGCRGKRGAHGHLWPGRRKPGSRTSLEPVFCLPAGLRASEAPSQAAGLAVGGGVGPQKAPVSKGQQEELPPNAREQGPQLAIRPGLRPPLRASSGVWNPNSEGAMRPGARGCLCSSRTQKGKRDEGNETGGEERN